MPHTSPSALTKSLDWPKHTSPIAGGCVNVATSCNVQRRLFLLDAGGKTEFGQTYARGEKKNLVGASQEANETKLLNVVSLGTQLRKESLDVDW